MAETSAHRLTFRSPLYIIIWANHAGKTGKRTFAENMGSRVKSLPGLFAMGLAGNRGMASLRKKVEQTGMGTNKLAWIICALTGFSIFCDPEAVTGALLAKSLPPGRRAASDLIYLI